MCIHKQGVILTISWSSLQMVRNEYEELYDGDVASVNVVYNTATLDALVAEYNTGLRNLEDLIDDYASQKTRDMHVKRKKVRHSG